MGYIQEMRKKIGHDRLMLVGAGVLPCRDGQVLLQKRRDNGCWCMHGGCMEMGESAEDTARRELREETGLVAGELTLLGVFSGEEMLYTYPNGDMVCNVTIAYVCRELSGEMIADGCEVAELRWFDAYDLPENISPPDKQVMRAFSAYVRDLNG